MLLYGLEVLYNYYSCLRALVGVVGDIVVPCNGSHIAVMYTTIRYSHVRSGIEPEPVAIGNAQERHSAQQTNEQTNKRAELMTKLEE